MRPDSIGQARRRPVRSSRGSCNGASSGSGISPLLPDLPDSGSSEGCGASGESLMSVKLYIGRSSKCCGDENWTSGSESDCRSGRKTGCQMVPARRAAVCSVLSQAVSFSVKRRAPAGDRVGVSERSMEMQLKLEFARMMMGGDGYCRDRQCTGPSMETA